MVTPDKLPINRLSTARSDAVGSTVGMMMAPPEMVPSMGAVLLPAEYAPIAICFAAVAQLSVFAAVASVLLAPTIMMSADQPADATAFVAPG